MTDKQLRLPFDAWLKEQRYPEWMASSKPIMKLYEISA